MVLLFGQVWLWSLLSFAAGVLLTWLVLVRPAKNRADELADRLITAHRTVRRESAPPVAADSLRDDKFDDWHVRSTRPPVDQVPEPTRRMEPVRPLEVARPNFRYDPEPDYDELPPVLTRISEPVKRDDRSSAAAFERHLAAGVERPHSLAERLSPDAEADERPALPRHVEATAVFPHSGLVSRDLEDDKPELPVEKTQFRHAADLSAHAEINLRHAEPTAPPELDVPVAEDFRPREVWYVQEPVELVENYAEDFHEDEVLQAAEEESEAEPVAVEDDGELEEVEEPAQVAAENTADLTSFVSVSSAEDEARRQELVEETPAVAAVPTAARPIVEPPRSLFEPTPDHGDEDLREQPVPEPTSPANDLPFVPVLAPALPQVPPNGTSSTGLPRRPLRPGGAPQQSFPAPHTPKPPASAPVPQSPHPVAPSPDADGRGMTSGGAARYQQSADFNPRSPFGPGSVLSKSDGLAPAPDFAVKATLTGRRYYTDESANFGETRADVWFRTVADAQQAGFRPAP